MCINQHRSSADVKCSFALNTFGIVATGAYHDVATRDFQDTIGDSGRYGVVFRTDFHALRRRSVGTCQIVGITSIIMVFCRSVAIVEAAFCDDANLTACDITFIVGLDTLTATAGSLGIQLAAIHIEIAVAADTCSRFRVAACGEGLVNFPCTITRRNDSSTSAIDGDIGVAIDSLASVCRDFNVDDTAIDKHICTCFNTVILSILHIQVDTFVNHDVALAMNAVLVISIDF